MVGPGIPVEVLERGLPFELEGGGRREDTELVQHRRQVLWGQQRLDNVGAVEAVDAVRAEHSDLKIRDQWQLFSSNAFGSFIDPMWWISDKNRIIMKSVQPTVTRRWSNHIIV